MEFLFIQTVHAASIIPDFTQVDDFGQFIKTIYNLSIGLVGVAVFVQFLRAGIEYMLAAGNVGKVEQAKEYMTNAILGAVLLLSAYLILNEINPDLLSVSMFNKSYVVEQLKKDLKPINTCSPTYTDSPNCQKTGSQEAVEKENQLEQSGIDVSSIGQVTSINQLNIDYLTGLTTNGGSGKVISSNTGPPSEFFFQNNPGGNFMILETDETLNKKIVGFGADATSVEIGGSSYQSYTDESEGVVYVKISDRWHIYFPER